MIGTYYYELSYRILEHNYLYKQNPTYNEDEENVSPYSIAWRQRLDKCRIFLLPTEFSVSDSKS